jgi:hypothetical protein
MRPRRFIGILERRLLGAAISVILFILERRLSHGNMGVTRNEPPDGEHRIS